mmetsp:Transcript_34005/g.71532  ORF Transcript_34005/g.71532 Transcript_34005/m.71532 type:complete len:307 (-) Transcript_34005:670-1590(-)
MQIMVAPKSLIDQTTNTGPCIQIWRERGFLSASDEIQALLLHMRKQCITKGLPMPAQIFTSAHPTSEACTFRFIQSLPRPADEHRSRANIPRHQRRHNALGHPSINVIHEHFRRKVEDFDVGQFIVLNSLIGLLIFLHTRQQISHGILHVHILVIRRACHLGHEIGMKQILIIANTLYEDDTRGFASPLRLVIAFVQDPIAPFLGRIRSVKDAHPILAHLRRRGGTRAATAVLVVQPSKHIVQRQTRRLLSQLARCFVLAVEEVGAAGPVGGRATILAHIEDLAFAAAPCDEILEFPRDEGFASSG